MKYSLHKSYIQGWGAQKATLLNKCKKNKLDLKASAFGA